jgi:phosphoglycolate phosphatase-like HAD superfamily hydrolase
VSAWDKLRCVAFDFDGTLVESNPIKRGSYFEVLAHVEGSGHIIERVLRENPGDDRHGILAKVHAALTECETPSLPKLGALVDAYSSLCETKVIACSPLPGALEALEALRGTRPLYLASATPEQALVRVVAGRGWASFFRGVYGGPRSKCENLERIRVQEGIDRDEIVYVGDGSVDREAAVRFGCPFLGFQTPATELPDSPLAPLVAEIAARSQR